jgi:hypothetical protein
MKWIALGLFLIGLAICAGCTNSPAGTMVTTPVTPAVSGMPDLVGNWTGTFNGYIETSGYQVYREAITMHVVEQDDRLFKGQFTYPMNGTIVTKDFAGALSRDWKSFEIIESPAGFSDGVIVSADEIEMIFRDTSSPSKIAIDTFRRSEKGR